VVIFDTSLEFLRCPHLRDFAGLDHVAARVVLGGALVMRSPSLRLNDTYVGVYFQVAVDDAVVGPVTLFCHVTLLHGHGWGVHRLSSQDVRRMEANVIRIFTNMAVPLAGTDPVALMHADGSINRVLIWPHVQHILVRNLWSVRNFLLSRGAREANERLNFHLSIDDMR